MTSDRIRHTPAERELIAARMLHLRELNPKLSLFMAFQTAQFEVLPISRRRPAKGISQVPWVEEEMKRVKARQDRQAKAKGPTTVEPPVTAPPAPPAQAVVRETSPQPAPQATPQVAAEPTLSTSAVGLLAQSLVAVFKEVLAHPGWRAALREALLQAAPPVPSAPATTPPPEQAPAPSALPLADDAPPDDEGDTQPGVRWPEPPATAMAAAFLKHNPLPRQTADRVVRKKVLVVGLLPAQANAIAADFGAKLDLSFYASNCNHKEAKEKAKNVDYVYAMIDFMDHSLIDGLKAVAKENFRRVNGTVSGLKTVLTGLVSSPATVS